MLKTSAQRRLSRNGEPEPRGTPARRPSMRQLEYFQAVAETLNVTRAAETLHMAQPALSRQIAALESQLGVALFSREGQRMQLTDAGRHLREKLPGVLQALDATLSRTRRIAEGQSLALGIGYSSAAMSSFLPEVIRQLRAAIPGLDPEFVERTSDQLVDDVIRGQLDLAFILHRPENPLLRTVPLREEPIGLIVPDHHPLARKRRVPLAALDGETLILFPRHTNPSMYDEILAACQAAGVTPARIREVAPRSIAIGLAAAGVGVATIASSLKHTCVRGTCFRHLVPPAPAIRFACILRTDADGAWVEALLEALTPLGVKGAG